MENTFLGFFWVFFSFKQITYFRERVEGFFRNLVGEGYCVLGFCRQLGLGFFLAGGWVGDVLF